MKEYGSNVNCERWLILAKGETMIRAIGFALLLSLISGCCVIDTFSYEPTIDEQIERERDKKKNPAPSFGFSC